MPRPRIPLRLSIIDGQPKLELGDVEITHFVKTDGFSINFVDFGGHVEPEVTMTLGCGRLDLDLDVELLEGLLEAARTAAA